MAQIEVINLEKLSSAQGYKMPANTPGAASPDNITHAQLRKTPFSVAGLVAQGTAVSGENSTFEFSVADGDADELLKLYVSTDGTNYTEENTYGGTNGKNPFGTVDLSGYATLGTAQSITATKTFNTNANLVIASGSDITVQTGGDLTLADAPTASTDATNKAYVDGLVGYTEYIAWVNQSGTNAPTSTIVKNNTGRTFTWSYLDAGNYRLTPSGTNIFSDQTKWTIDYTHWFSDGLGTIAAYCDCDLSTVVTGGTFDFTTIDNIITVTGTGGNIDSRQILLNASEGATPSNALMSNMLLHIRIFP